VILRVARVLLWTLVLAVTGVAALVTVRLYAPAPIDRSDREIVADALPRLAYLRRALDHGAAEEMQALFPEGYFFTYTLYGLTWVDVGARAPAHRARALAEARWALAHADGPAGRAVFDATLKPPYGVFHAGWTTWLRAGVVRLGGADELDRLGDGAAALADAFGASMTGGGSPFLPAYPGQAWPCDSTVGIAAVAVAGDLTGSATGAGASAGDDRGPLIARWLKAADARRDPATGLLPHRVDFATGTPIEGARATSQTIALRFLREVDPAGTRRDWSRFRDRYASTVPGLPGVREYPRGHDGGGDVDSGPLVFGLSGSASAVALGDATLFGDRRGARRLAGLAETAGLGLTWRGERRYLGGAIPVADAFLAWSYAAAGWRHPADRPSRAGIDAWRLPWHQPTVGLVTALWLFALLSAHRPARGGVPPNGLT
jgi:hypothetical protein